MIRLGIVGTNYGRQVLLPAFRLDSRCEVAALAGADAAKAAEAARQTGVPKSFGDWRRMLDEAELDAVAIATPPKIQPEIAVAALRLGLPTFVEKPMAADMSGARAMLEAAGGLPAAIDFSFTGILAWRTAKSILHGGGIGRLRHVTAAWQVENASTRLRLRNWKTGGAEGGGALGNFASHSLHDLEWFCGPIAGLSARLSGLPGEPAFETGVTMSLAFSSGAAGSYAMSCAAYLGSGHRLEFYGEEGVLVLANATADYMRGFTLFHARRPDTELKPVAVENDPADPTFSGDGRIAPVSRLAKAFLDAVECGQAATPGFAEGFRVQALMNAVRRSHDTGRWIDTSELESA